MAIRFYTKIKQHGEFSNFSDHGIEMDGKWYPTVEHYFQAMKFPGHEYAEEIRQAASPTVAKRLGRTRKVKLREDWDEVRLDIMRNAVQAKFRAHTKLHEQLIATGDEDLIEAAPADYFWGCGRTGTGKNWLGRILMEVRKELQREAESRGE